MNILFVCYRNLNCNSGLHIFHLANELVSFGNECLVFVPNGKALSIENGECQFITMEYDELDSTDYFFSNKKDADIIHVWTPREIVRKFVTNALLKRFKCPYLVHFEDNEGHILEKELGLPTEKHDDFDVPLHLSHPVRYKNFISESSGLTVLIESLLIFKPDQLPAQVFWPGFDDIFYYLPKSNHRLKKKLGIGNDIKIIVYMGNAHASNRKEIFSLYLAVYILNRNGIPMKLIRTGVNSEPLLENELGSLLEENCIELGFLPRNDLPGLLSLADILVQPGRANEFNDYRFPSKIPDFLVSGKPVILPRTNIGKKMDDGENCLLMDRGDAIDIARKIEWLLNHEDVALQIGKQGREFAKNKLSWNKSARKVEDFYHQILINDECDIKKINRF